MKPKKPSSKKTEIISAKKENYFGLIAILIVTLFIYSNAINHDFTNWDDPTYVTENPLLAKPIKEQVIYFFKNPYAKDQNIKIKKGRTKEPINNSA
jgi:hypothetical protein